MGPASERSDSAVTPTMDWAMVARGWRRPRLRLYPAKPKVGLRTGAPNEAWHIDVTIIRSLDGTKAYDNF